jgi:hypothetical protein
MATITNTPIRTFVSGETVTPTKLNELAQSTVALTAGTIVEADIATNAVTNVKIASGVDASKLTTGTLPDDRIGASAITTARINDAAVIPAKLSQPYTLATAQNSTSVTSIDFTGIPSWARRITVILNGVSTNGGSQVLVRVGAGSIVATGYTGSSGFFTNSSVSVVDTLSVGFNVSTAAASSNVRHGHLVITKVTGNVWVCSGSGGFSDTASAFVVGGSISLSSTLDRVRITTVNGSDTFDAGSINISYEG